MWDLGAGTRYTVDLGEPVLGVDAIPGDRLLLVGATVRVLDLDSQALRARARDLVPRSLTEAECVVHLGRRCAEV